MGKPPLQSVIRFSVHCLLSACCIHINIIESRQTDAPHFFLCCPVLCPFCCGSPADSFPPESIRQQQEQHEPSSRSATSTELGEGYVPPTDRPTTSPKIQRASVSRTTFLPLPAACSLFGSVSSVSLASLPKKTLVRTFLYLQRGTLTQSADLFHRHPSTRRWWWIYIFWAEKQTPTWLNCTRRVKALTFKKNSSSSQYKICELGVLEYNFTKEHSSSPQLKVVLQSVDCRRPTEIEFAFLS